MAIHRGLADLSKHLGTSSGLSMLLNKTNIKDALQSEGERLQRYLIEEIDLHYSNFTPEYYQRTGAWLESVRLNPVQQVGNTVSISITFDDNLANHGDAYVPLLMDSGWGDHSYQTPHYQGFTGTHYIENAITRWNADNKFGFKATVYLNGVLYTVK